MLDRRSDAFTPETLVGHEMMFTMHAHAVRFAFPVVLTAAIALGCSGGNQRRDTEPPLGFGVRNEAHFSDVLVSYSVSRSDAECVARHAFAASPSTDVYADGSYDITQSLLAAAGVDCGIDWSDYDFSSD